MLYTLVVRHDKKGNLRSIICPTLQKVLYPSNDIIMSDVANLNESDPVTLTDRFQNDSIPVNTIIKQAEVNLRKIVQQLNQHEIYIDTSEDNYDELLQNDEDYLIKVNIPSKSKKHFFARALPNISTFSFVFGLLVLSLSDVLAIQTVETDLVATMTTAIIGAVFAMSMTLLLYFVSDARGNLANIGGNIDNYFTKKKLPADTLILLEDKHKYTKLLIDENNADELSQRNVSASTTSKVLSRLLLAIPAFGASGFRAVANYQNTIIVGEKLRTSGRLSLDPTLVFGLAVMVGFLEMSNGSVFNVSFAFKIAKFLENKFSRCQGCCGENTEDSVVDEKTELLESETGTYCLD